MPEAGAGTAEAVAAILERYYGATLELAAVLERKDDEGVAGPVAARARCIEEYAEAMAHWRSVPEGARDRSLPDVVKWHHIRINQAETDVLRLADALKDEVSGEMARLGTARKLDRAYQSPDGGPIRILNSEG